MERRRVATEKQITRETAASRSPDGKPIKFVTTLSEMEIKDHEAARVIHDERETRAIREEEELVTRIREKTQAMQKENYIALVHQQSMTKQDKHAQKCAQETGYLASIKVNDLVKPVDPRKVQVEKNATQNQFLIE